CKRDRGHMGNRRDLGSHLGRSPAADSDLHIAAFKLELGNVLIDQELDQLAYLFAVHRTRSTASLGRIMRSRMGRRNKATRGPRRLSRRRLQTTNSSFGVGVSTSCPFAVTRTMSSIRTPPNPGT